MLVHEVSFGEESISTELAVIQSRSLSGQTHSSDVLLQFFAFISRRSLQMNCDRITIQLIDFREREVFGL
jgi:hypothetical protein